MVSVNEDLDNLFHFIYVTYYLSRISQVHHMLFDTLKLYIYIFLHF